MDDELLEYLVEIVPGALLECAGCPAEREAAVMIRRESKLYHSQECADRSLAVYTKPEPKRVDCDGWSI
jgi:hypothetical protein